MFVKFLVFALVAVAAVQCYIPYNGTEFEEAQVISHEIETLLKKVHDQGEIMTETQLEGFSGLFDKVKELLNTLKDKIGSAIKSGVNALAGAVDSLEEKARGFVDSFTGQMDTQTQSLLAELDRMKTQARSLGPAAEHCLEGAENRIKALPKAKQARVVDCVKEKVGQAKSIVTGTTGEVEKTWENLKALSKEFSDCGSGFKAVWCYTKLVGKLAAEVVSTPLRMQSQIRRGINLIANFQSSFVSCTLTPNTELTKEGTELIHQLENCMHNKDFLLERFNITISAMPEMTVMPGKSAMSSVKN